MPLDWWNDWEFSHDWRNILIDFTCTHALSKQSTSEWRRMIRKNQNDSQIDGNQLHFNFKFHEITKFILCIIKGISGVEKPFWVSCYQTTTLESQENYQFRIFLHKIYDLHLRTKKPSQNFIKWKFLISQYLAKPLNFVQFPVNSWNLVQRRPKFLVFRFQTVNEHEPNVVTPRLKISSISAPKKAFPRDDNWKRQVFLSIRQPLLCSQSVAINIASEISTYSVFFWNRLQDSYNKKFQRKRNNLDRCREWNVRN